MELRMETDLTKWSFVLAYGFVAIFMVSLSFYATCLSMDCSYAISAAGEVLACPMHLMLPLAFVSFMMAAIPPMAKDFSLNNAITYGLCAVAALFIAITLVLVLKPMNCPLLAAADIGVYTTFVTSIGSAFMAFLWKEKKK